MSFENAVSQKYNSVILGSSKAYRGIDPFILDSAYNFAHDNDVFNQMYYKLNYLLGQKKQIKSIIVGYDYFSFSFISGLRNYVYKEYLPKQYLEDYDSNFNLSFFYIDSIFNSYLNLNFTNTFKPFLQGLFFSDPNRPFLTEKGQLKKFSSAGNFSNTIIHDKADVLDIQLRYFNKIIFLCKENNIKVFLVILPTTKYEVEHYTSSDKVHIRAIARNMVAQNTHVTLLDYETLSSLTPGDFEDAIHLNAWGAQKFSALLKKDIQQILHNAL